MASNIRKHRRPVQKVKATIQVNSNPASTKQLTRMASQLFSKVKKRADALIAQLEVEPKNGDIKVMPKKERHKATELGIPLTSLALRRLLEVTYWILLVATSTMWCLAIRELTSLDGILLFVFSAAMLFFPLGMTVYIKETWAEQTLARASQKAREWKPKRTRAILMTVLLLVIEASVTGYSLYVSISSMALGGQTIPPITLVGISLASGVTILLAILVGTQSAFRNVVTAAVTEDLKSEENSKKYEELMTIQRDLQELTDIESELQDRPVFSQHDNHELLARLEPLYQTYHYLEDAAHDQTSEDKKFGAHK